MGARFAAMESLECGREGSELREFVGVVGITYRYGGCGTAGAIESRYVGVVGSRSGSSGSSSSSSSSGSSMLPNH